MKGIHCRESDPARTQRVDQSPNASVTRYWLYVVWDPLTTPMPRLVKIQNPFQHLEHSVKVREVIRRYEIRLRPSRTQPETRGSWHEQACP